MRQVPGHAHVRDLGAAADGHEGGGAADGAGHHAREGAARPRHRAQEQDAGRQTKLEQGADESCKRSIGFYNHEEGLYYDLLLVESAYVLTWDANTRVTRDRWIG